MSMDTTKKIKQVTYNGKDIPLRGYDTSDATVTAGDMARNVIAYGKDGKVTGSLVRSNNPSNANSLGGTSISSGDGTIWFGGYFDEGTVIASKSKMGAPLEFLGNATAADVAKGKTFTSAAGLKVVGTAAGSSAADVTFDLYNNDFDALAVVYMANGTITQVTIPLSDHKGITTPEGSIVALIDQRFKGDTIDLVPTSGSITQGWRDSNITLFVAGAETNGMNIDVNMT